MITQTLALFVDAYRELNSKKLFWIVMILSLLFVGAFATLGINDKGLTLLAWEFPIEIFNTNVIEKATFYKLLFFVMGFQIWLTWAATILALISTAGIIPDFIAGGAIELTLSKPIGRLRLFLTKYATGLLFVALQVLVFTAASFLVIGLRGGEWIWPLFWAVPIIVCFFSYLFCFSALAGLLTRSTIASLLVTMLLWLMIFLLHAAETGFLLTQKVSYAQAVVLQTNQVELTRSQLSALEQDETLSGDERLKRRDELASTLADREQKLETLEKSRQKFTRIHAVLFAVKTALPKTSETVELLGRAIFGEDEVQRLSNESDQQFVPKAQNVGGVWVSTSAINKEVEATAHARSVVWVVGTSLAFEGVVLAIAAWIFSRRDF